MLPLPRPLRRRQDFDRRFHESGAAGRQGSGRRTGPKSTRLLKLQVDTGVDQRTIVAGIAEAYEPETLVGRSIAVVFNLKPAKLMGIESNGMVLCASPEGGKPMIVTFDDPPAPGRGCDVECISLTDPFEIRPLKLDATSAQACEAMAPGLIAQIARSLATCAIAGQAAAASDP